MSRPTKDEKDYFNYDGGVFHIGYSCSLNDVNLLFQECQFFNNHAYFVKKIKLIQFVCFFAQSK